MSYVYIRSEPPQSDGEEWYEGLWTVGFYKPNGEWNPETDWPTATEAAERCAWLNGSGKGPYK